MKTTRRAEIPTGRSGRASDASNAAGAGRGGQSAYSTGMDDDTLAVTAGRHPEANFGLVNPPVYHASTVTFPSLAALEAAEARKLDVPYYGRNGTPSTFAFEEAVAALEGGHRSVALGSGKAAVLAALTAFVEAGDHVLVTDSAYGPTRAFCDRFLGRFGVETTYYDPCIGAAIAGLIRPTRGWCSSNRRARSPSRCRTCRRSPPPRAPPGASR